ncbi:MAG: stage II sporulation protein M [Candidatus Brocadiia bacterium]|nr:stage II sporulation protein M [Candidatus Brocadiia bacterium]
MRETLEYVLLGHWRPAAQAAALFGLGLAVSLPLARLRVRALEWLPIQALKLVLRLMGPRPGLARMTAVIWGFNATAIFIYMASGFQPLLPKVFALWTGMNIGLVLAASRREGEDVLWGLERPRDGWVPPTWVAAACGMLVVLLELPCFWYAIAMGVTLGRDVQAGEGYYLAALGVRGWAYARLIVPALLVSAAAESVAIRAGLPLGDTNVQQSGGPETGEEQRVYHSQ